MVYGLSSGRRGHAKTQRRKDAETQRWPTRQQRFPKSQLQATLISRDAMRMVLRQYYVRLHYVCIMSVLCLYYHIYLGDGLRLLCLLAIINVLGLTDSGYWVVNYQSYCDCSDRAVPSIIPPYGPYLGTTTTFHSPSISISRD